MKQNTITICGSMQFADKMQEAKKELENMGFKIFLPEATEVGASLKTRKDYSKLKAGFIKKHFDHIKNSDAILVLNYTKNNIKNYIGGNTLLEMGLAFYLNKPIYLINPAPARVRYAEEIDAMGFIVIDNDLDKIKP